MDLVSGDESDAAKFNIQSRGEEMYILRNQDSSESSGMGDDLGTHEFVVEKKTKIVKQKRVERRRTGKLVQNKKTGMIEEEFEDHEFEEDVEVEDGWDDVKSKKKE